MGHCGYNSARVKRKRAEECRIKGEEKHDREEKQREGLILHTASKKRCMK